MLGFFIDICLGCAIMWIGNKREMLMVYPLAQKPGTCIPGFLYLFARGGTFRRLVAYLSPSSHLQM